MSRDWEQRFDALAARWSLRTLAERRRPYMQLYPAVKDALRGVGPITLKEGGSRPPERRCVVCRPEIHDAKPRRCFDAQRKHDSRFDRSQPTQRVYLTRTNEGPERAWRTTLGAVHLEVHPVSPGAFNNIRLTSDVNSSQAARAETLRMRGSSWVRGSRRGHERYLP